MNYSAEKNNKVYIMGEIVSDAARNGILTE